MRLNKKKSAVFTVILLCLFLGAAIYFVVERPWKSGANNENRCGTIEFQDIDQASDILDMQIANIIDMQITKDGSCAYVIKACSDDDAKPQSLFRYEKTKEGYDNPKEIEFPDDVFPNTVNLSADEKEMYFSLVDVEEYNAFLDSTDMSENYSMWAAKASIENDVLGKLEEIKEINTNSYVTVLGVMEDGSILYMSAENSDEIPQCMEIAYKTADGYSSTALDLTEDLLDEVNNSISDAVVSSDGSYLAWTNGSELYLSKKKNGSYSAPKEITKVLPEYNDGDNRFFWFLNTTSDGKNLVYLLCHSVEEETGDRSLAEEENSSMTYQLEGKEEVVRFSVSAGKIRWHNLHDLYEAKTAQIVEQMEEDPTEPYDSSAYLENNFTLVSRNKGDMTQKQGIYYEIFVRSFADSDGDGIGDLNGVTNHLDYLKELGVDGIWLMPIFESNSYHGYDVTDYTKILPDYGTEEDLKTLLSEAHRRDIKVILDFVINHTSDEHPWFVEACKDPQSKYAGYYRFVNKEDTDQYSLSDVSPWGSSVWNKKGNSYYYGIFGPGMPDLNYNNPDVRKEIISAAEKWVKLGVDGYRLDAAMHIYSDPEFRTVENPEQANVQWWNEFAAALEQINPEIYLVGEVWHEDDYLEAYAQPFDTKFNFAFQDQLITALNNESALLDSNENLADSLNEILEACSNVDTQYLDGVITGNHDLPRIFSAVGSDEKARLAANIDLTLPGNPFIYYGEELGMQGGGENDAAYRTPFLWGDDAQTTEMENGENKQTDSLIMQMQDEDSMYHHYQELISLRKENEGLWSGTYEPLDTGNDSIMAYKRGQGQNAVYVFHNLSGNSAVISMNEVKKGTVLYSSKMTTTADHDIITLDSYSTIMIGGITE